MAAPGLVSALAEAAASNLTRKSGFTRFTELLLLLLLLDKEERLWRSLVFKR